MTRIPWWRWRTESASVLADAEIVALLPGQSGDAYVATPQGIARRGVDGAWNLLPDSNSLGPVHALARDARGWVWVGADGGLARLAGEDLLPEASLAPTGPVNALLVDRAGTLWVGTASGLGCLVGVPPADCGCRGVEAVPVSALWDTPAGEIWAGTINDGAYCLRTDTCTPCPGGRDHITWYNSHEGLADDVIFSGAQDSQDNLWFGTSRGLSRLAAGADPANQSSWRTLKSPDLAGAVVNTLLLDGAHPGNLWAGTKGGLSLIEDDYPPRSFGREDGLPHKWVKALALDAAGKLWIGTASGLAYHRDADQGPQVARPVPLAEGHECPNGCFQGVDYQTGSVGFAFAGSDLGDLDGLQFEYWLTASRGASLPIPVHAVTSVASISFPPSTSPLLGGIYTVTLQALDKHFNPSARVVSASIPVQPRPLGDWLRDWRVLPFIVLGVVVISVYLWGLIREKLRYPYADLEFSLGPAQDPGLHHVQMVVTTGPTRLIRLQQRLAGLAGRPPIASTLEYDLSFSDALVTQRLAAWEKGTGGEEALVEAGQALYGAIFSLKATEVLKRHLNLPLRKTGLLRQGVRVRLCFDDLPALNRYPWELMYEDEIRFLARRSELAVARYVKREEGGLRQAIPPLKILFVMAQPAGQIVQDLPKLRLKEERARLGALEGKWRARIKVEELAGVSAARQANMEEVKGLLPDRIQKALDGETRMDVLHFAGHAGPDRTSTDSSPEIVLYCENEHGEYLALGPDKLEKWLRELKAQDKAPLLVVLDACRTADMASRLVETFLEGGAQAVIGMQWPVKDLAARVFVEGFYETLARRGQVDHAVSVGRSRVAAKVPVGDRDWAAPVLVMQREDGAIFKLRR